MAIHNPVTTSTVDSNGNSVPQGGIGGGAYTIPALSANQGESRSAFCAVGGGAIVPNTDLSGVASADIIEWNDFTETASKSLDVQVAVDQLVGNNHLGWWVTVNAGSAVIAKQRMREALDTASGIEIAVYATGSTIDADENKGSVVVPPNSELSIVSVDPILDVYVMPVAQAAVAVGTSLLTAVLS